MLKILQLDRRDDVLIALIDLRQGENIERNSNRYTLLSNILAKHKFLTAWKRGVSL